MFKSEKTKRIVIISGVTFVVIYALLYLLIQAGYSIEDFSSVGDTILSVFTPIIVGGLIAYLLNPILRFFEKKILKKIPRPRLRRALSVLLTYLLALIIIIGLFAAIIPSIVTSVQEFGSNIDNYVTALQATLSAGFDDLNQYIDEHPSIRELLETMGIYNWIGQIIEEDTGIPPLSPDAPPSNALPPSSDADSSSDETSAEPDNITEAETEEVTDTLTDSETDASAAGDPDTDTNNPSETEASSDAETLPETDSDMSNAEITDQTLGTDEAVSEPADTITESESLSQKHELSFDAFMNFLMAKLSEIAASFSESVTDFANSLIGLGFSFVNFLKNMILGIFISIYLLLGKERVGAQCKRFVAAVFPKKSSEEILRIAKRSDRTVGRFILGTMIDAVIVALVTLILLTIFDIKYAFLIAIIIGFTNMIPFFGPFIGAIPSALLLLIDDITMIVNHPDEPVRFSCITFILLILIIQQIDGNIINPRVIGNSTGLSSLGVILSVTVMSGFFGFFGMLLGVPVAAIFIGLGKEIIEKLLAKKKLPVALADYYSAHSAIPPETPEEELEIHEHTAFYRGLVSVHEKLRHFFRKILYRNHGESKSLKMWVKMKLGVRNVKHKVNHTIRPNHYKHDEVSDASEDSDTNEDVSNDDVPKETSDSDEGDGKQ